MGKIKQPKGKTRTPKKKRLDDTIDEEDEQNVKETMSKEPAIKDIVKESVKKILSREKKSKSKEKEKDRTSREKKLPSPEKTERETTSQARIFAAAKGFCRYLLDMKEASLSTYFDEHLAKYTPSNCTFIEWEKNMPKNRSKTHKLIDSSRVQIPDGYINASHIKFDQSNTEFIMTQYPLPDTIRDFWRMVSHKRVTQIITIFEPYVDEAIEEFNKIQSTISPVPTSTPDSVNGTPLSTSQKSHTREQIMSVSIRCETNQLKSFYPLFTDHYMNLNGWLINTRKVEIDERNKHWMSIYTVEVVAEECSEASYTRVFNCTTWPWKKVPSEEKKLLALVRAPYKDSAPLVVTKPEKPEPIIVMCDLGLDRSATVVLTSIIIELVLAGKTPDCDALFKKMRDQRANVFTMSIFYTYAIRAALVYLKMKLALISDSAKDDVKTMINEALAKVPFVPNPRKI